MSGFFANLATRSLGLAEVVRPRVPALFEPHGMAGQGNEIVPARDERAQPGPAAAAVSEGDTGQAAQRPQREWREWPVSSSVARGEEDRWPREMRVGRSAARESTAGEEAGREAPLRTALAPEIPEVQAEDESRVVKIGGKAPSKLETVARESEGRSTVEAEEAGVTQPKTDLRGRSMPPRVIAEDEDGSGVHQRSMERRSALPRARVPDEAASLPRREVRAVPASAPDEPKDEARLGMRAAARTGSPIPVALPSPPAVAMAAVSRQEGVRRPGRRVDGQAVDGARLRPEGQPSAPEPAVQISIGRVEVRAIFPETPVRRAEPVRRRPTLSLDDFLRGHERGGR